MTFIRQILAPLLLLAGTITLVILGFTINQTGLVALSLLCLWPMFFGISGWVIRGLKDTYQIVPKAQSRKRQPEAFG